MLAMKGKYDVFGVAKIWLNELHISVAILCFRGTEAIERRRAMSVCKAGFKSK